MSNFDTVDNIIVQSIDVIQQISSALSDSHPPFKQYASVLHDLRSEYGKITTNLLLADNISKKNDQSQLLLNFYNEIDRLNIPNKINDVLDSINVLDEKSAQLVGPLVTKFNKLPRYESLEKPTEEIMRCKNTNCGELMTINQ